MGEKQSLKGRGGGERGKREAGGGKKEGGGPLTVCGLKRKKGGR